MSSGVLRTVLVQPTFPFLSLWQLFVRSYDCVAFLFYNELTVQSLMVQNYLYSLIFLILFSFSCKYFVHPCLRFWTFSFCFFNIFCPSMFRILKKILFLSYFLPIHVLDSETFFVSFIFLAHPCFGFRNFFSISCIFLAHQCFRFRTFFSFLHISRPSPFLSLYSSPENLLSLFSIWEKQIVL